MPTGQSDNAIKFTFDKPNAMPSTEDLMAALSQEAGEASQDVAAATTPEATAAPKETTPAPDPAQEDSAQSASTEDLKTYKIKVDGRELVVTERDLLEGHMRHRDYTQKTQTLAERERQLAAVEQQFKAREAQYQAELQGIEQFLNSPEAIQTYMQKAFGQNLLDAQADQPNTPLTRQQVAAIARESANEVRTQIQREFAHAQQQAMMAEQQVQRSRLQSTLDAHVNGLLDKYPTLKKLEDVEELLYADASKAGVRDINAALAALSDAAARRDAAIRAIAAEEQKQTAVQAARLRATSTEPAGGNAPRQPAGKKLSLDSKHRNDLISAGVQDIQAFLDANA